MSEKDVWDRPLANFVGKRFAGPFARELRDYSKPYIDWGDPFTAGVLRDTIIERGLTYIGDGVYVFSTGEGGMVRGAGKETWSHVLGGLRTLGFDLSPYITEEVPLTPYEAAPRTNVDMLRSGISAIRRALHGLQKALESLEQNEGDGRNEET